MKTNLRDINEQMHFDDYDYWKKLAIDLDKFLPQPNSPMDIQRLLRVMKESNYSPINFRNATGLSIEQFIELNPDFSLCAIIGLMYEDINEKSTITT